MEQKKELTKKEIDANNRNAVVYIEAFIDNILTLHWKVYNFLTRKRSNTYVKLHHFLSKIHKDTSENDRRIGVVGTGFFVTKDILVTNIHVVAGAKTVAAKQINLKLIPQYLPEHKGFAYAYKTEYSKEPILYTIQGVKAYDIENDLVLLKVTENTNYTLTLGESNIVKQGDEVNTLSYANGEYKQIKGVISYIDERGKFELKTKFFGGVSGSPILNNSGEVIGIATGTDQQLGEDPNIPSSLNNGFAVHSNALRSLLDQVGEIETFASWQKRPHIRAHGLRSLAQMKTAQGKLKAALAKYKLAIKLNPDFVELYQNIGVLRHYCDKNKTGLEEYDKAIQIKPNYINSYYNRGTAKSKLGKEKADQGKLMEAQKLYNESMEDFDVVIQQRPDKAAAYNNLGWTKYLLGQLKTEQGNESEAQKLYEETLIDVNNAIKLDPDLAESRPSFYHTRAVAKAALGEHQEAIQDFIECIRIKPDEALYYRDRALSKQRIGQHEEANADFEKAVELDPSFNSRIDS